MEGNGKVCGYIADGYTRKGYIEESPRLYPAVRFSYRPMIASERAAVNDRVANAKAAESEAYAAKAIASHVCDWDLCDCEGKSLPVKAEVAMRLQPALSNRLYRIVIGSDAPDQDPSEKASPETDQEIQELLRGSAEKNSATG